MDAKVSLYKIVIKSPCGRKNVHFNSLFLCVQIMVLSVCNNSSLLGRNSPEVQLDNFCTNQHPGLLVIEAFSIKRNLEWTLLRQIGDLIKVLVYEDLEYHNKEKLELA